MPENQPLTDADQNLIHALVHDASVKLVGMTSQSVGLDAELDNLRDVLTIADKLMNGSADDDDRNQVPNVVHPQVRSLYL